MLRMATSKATCVLAGITCAIWLAGCETTGKSTPIGSTTHRGNEASGFLAPTGPPTEPPVRIEAGDGCIVEVQQTYAVSGSLSGSLQISFRILVAGPCGYPPGTFDEQWIAYGKFAGTVNGSPASGGLSYVAAVGAGGTVDGHIVLGPGLSGDLRVRGSFSDGRLSYEGWVDVGQHNKPVLTDVPSARG